MKLLYTDGACRGNPGPGGWAYLVKPDNISKSGFMKETTNNRMELFAIIKGLESLAPESEVHIFTDSSYCLKGATEWMDGWIRNNWKNSSNKPVKNKDLWLRLNEAIEKHKSVKWTWVKGHNGHPENEIVDRMASNASQVAS